VQKSLKVIVFQSNLLHHTAQTVFQGNEPRANDSILCMSIYVCSIILKFVSVYDQLTGKW